MNMNFGKLKRQALKSISGKWKICVLGFFVPFILMLLTLGLCGNVVFTGETEIKGAFCELLISCAYAFVAFSFSVGVYSVLLSDVPQKTDFPVGKHFFIMSFFGFCNSFYPVMLTKVVFLLFSFAFSDPIRLFLYDTLFFTCISYYKYIVITSVLDIVVKLLSVYVTLGCAFVPCLIADIPFLKGKIAVSMSFAILKKRKFKLFLLMLSLVGWYILGAFAFFVGIFFAMAYSASVICEYYKNSRPKLMVKTVNIPKKPL